MIDSAMFFNTDYASAPSNVWAGSTSAVIPRPEFASQPQCEECPRALECMADAMPKYFLEPGEGVTDTRYRLPCIDDGVELVASPYIGWTDDNTITLVGAFEGTPSTPLTTTITTSTIFTAGSEIATGDVVYITYDSDGDQWVANSHLPENE